MRAQGDIAGAKEVEDEIGRITRAEAYRTNFIDSGVAIIDAARNLDETIADAAKGLAGAIDAVFMEDRNPAEIYRDLNEQFDIVIEDFDTLSPADQQEVLGRIQGNLLAEGTKIIVGGGAGALRTGDVIRTATRVLKDETGALTPGKGRRRNNDGDTFDNVDPNNPSNAKANSPSTDGEAGNGSRAFTRFEPEPNLKDIPPSSQIHIIDGEINARGKAAGGHNSNSTNLRLDRETVNIDGSGNGVFEAKVSIRDANGHFVAKRTNGGKSTFFPEGWDSTRILKEINEALENPVVSSTANNQYVTPSGIKVTIFRNPDGTVRSAFPNFPQVP